MIRVLLCSAILCLATRPSLAQDKKLPPDDTKVGEAIRKGIEWLKSNGDMGGGRDCRRELVLLTMIHAGVKTNDPVFSELFKKMLEEKPEFTYRTALRAMVLEEVHRVKYQPQIYHCAQFLVDNQSREGFWGYGVPTDLDEIPPVKEAVASGGVKVYGGGDSVSGVKPKVVRRLMVKKKKDEGGSDNSNSQYAALGLRSCHDAGIGIPEEVIERAIKWWREKQENASSKNEKPAATGTGMVAEPLGWDYKDGGSAYGSMTVGALGALTIFLHMQGKNWKADKDLAEGAAWIGRHFTVTSNPKKGNDWHYYYLYGLERAGVLYDAERFGSRAWYTEGAWYLLENQKPEGHWGDVNNTCFAILFLKRATRPLVASEAAGSKK